MGDLGNPHYNTAEDLSEDVYTLTLTSGDIARLFLALGGQTGYFMKEKEFDAARQCLNLARAIHEQKESQDAENT